MFICLITAIDRSFKEDGGIGGFVDSAYEVQPDNDGYIIMKFFFDNIFFIGIMIIMLNILAGNVLIKIIFLNKTLQSNYDSYLHN